MTRYVLVLVITALVCCSSMRAFADENTTEEKVLICDDSRTQSDIAYEYVRLLYIAFLDNKSQDDADVSATESITSEVDDGERMECVSRDAWSVEFLSMEDDCADLLQDWCLEIYTVSYIDMFGEQQTGYAIQGEMYDELSNVVYDDAAFRLAILNKDMFDGLGYYLGEALFSIFRRAHHCPTVRIEATTFTIDDGTC